MKRLARLLYAIIQYHRRNKMCLIKSELNNMNNHLFLRYNLLFRRGAIHSGNTELSLQGNNLKEQTKIKKNSKKEIKPSNTASKIITQLTSFLPLSKTTNADIQKSVYLS